MIFLFATFVIGLAIFIISLSLSLLTALGTIFKRVGATAFGIIPILFLLFSPCLCFVLELVIFHFAPHAWGIAYIFIVMNVGFLALQYVLLVGSAIFTKNSIYRLTQFLVWKKHTYDDVIGYVMKKSSGLVTTRFGQHTVVTFDVEIYFNDNQYASFSTKDQSNRKVAYIKQLLEEHHCHRNGRIKREFRTYK